MITTFLALWLISLSGFRCDDQCSSKDSDCGTGGVFDEAEYNQYKFRHLTTREDFMIRHEIDPVDMTKHKDPLGALAKLLALEKKYPKSARIFSALSRTYRILYNQLNEEHKSIGRLEYIKKSVEVAQRAILLAPGHIPEELLYSITEFALANCEALKEREWTISVLKTIVDERPESYPEEDIRFYKQSLIDELFLTENFKEAVERLDLLIEEDEKANNGIHVREEFLKGLIYRFEEKKKDPIYYRESEDDLLKVHPQNEQEAILLVDIIHTLEKELRLESNEEMLDLMFEFAVDIGLFPSKYQRTTTIVRDLYAQPVWNVTELGSAQYKLLDLQKNWEKIRDEALILMDVTPEQNFTRGEIDLDRQKKWKQLIFHGFGKEAFPDWICDKAPFTCSKLKNFKEAVEAPLGTMKLSIIEGGAYIEPHVGGINARLRAHLGLVVPQSKNGTAKMVVAKKHELTWGEGELFVFDDSFEHEVINDASERRIVLIVDIRHPELTDAQWEELDKQFRVVDEGNPDGPIMMGDANSIKS